MSSPPLGPLAACLWRFPSLRRQTVDCGVGVVPYKESTVAHRRFLIPNPYISHCPLKIVLLCSPLSALVYNSLFKQGELVMWMWPGGTTSLVCRRDSASIRH